MEGGVSGVALSRFHLHAAIHVAEAHWKERHLRADCIVLRAGERAGQVVEVGEAGLKADGGHVAGCHVEGAAAYVGAGIHKDAPLYVLRVHHAPNMPQHMAFFPRPAGANRT
eukprot:scaffold19809_cov75-Phaeocystis_antarctica.AAC.4